MTNPTPPFSQRAVLLLVAAALCALVMGGLTFLESASVPLAVMAGLTALGGALAFFHAHTRSDDER